MGVYELALRRRTIRRFRDKPVPYEILEKCVNAARLSPSASNLQPLEYILVDDEPRLSQVFTTLRWAGYIRPQGDPPPGKRPQAYVVILKKPEVGMPSSVYDVGMAVENMILVALEKGVGSCAIASVNRDKLRPVLNIPDSYEIPLVLALGYPDESPVEEPFDGSVKYWKDDNGVLHVPKKKLASILHRNTF